MDHIKWEKRSYDRTREKNFLSLGKSHLISRLLAQRNIEVENAELFLSSDYNNLSHPHTLKGIKEAADLFCKVALRKGKIACCSDYDCDGILSGVMIKELCNIFHLSCNVFLPSRTEHGYGLNSYTIRDFKKQIRSIPDLLIICDCGTNNEKEIRELKEFGIPHVIILDHHIIDPDKISKSADVLINWHQTNSQEMCACGEVFQFIRGIRWLTKKVDPIEFLSYTAIGTLADVSPVIGDNRIIVKHGIQEHALKRVMSSGLSALISNSRIYTSHLSQEDIMFKIVPRINAVGRLMKPNIAFQLMTENDLVMAELMAKKMEDINNDRKKIQKQMEKEAFQMIYSNPNQYKYGVLLYNPTWPVGIVGVVASKITDALRKPALILGRNDFHNNIKGSGRSIENIHLKDILSSCHEMFESYGGHAMAVGIVLKPEYLEKANAMFNHACQQYYEKNGYPTGIQYYDAVLNPKAVTEVCAKELFENLYPYCSQFNPEPVFMLRNVVITDVEENQYEGYKSLAFYASKNGEKTGIKFRMFNDEIGGEIEGTKADIYFSFPQTSKFNKYTYVNVVKFVPKK